MILMTTKRDDASSGPDEHAGQPEQDRDVDNVTSKSDTNPRPLTILLIDDDPVEATLIEVALSDLAYDVTLETAVDGIEALAYLNRRPPYANKPDADLILVDLKMPRLDGFGFLETIRHETLKAVIWTTSNSATDRRRSLDLGAVDFITKPATFEQLKATLDEVIRTHLSPQPRSATPQP